MEKCVKNDICIEREREWFVGKTVCVCVCGRSRLT